MSVAVIVPYRGGCPHREKAWSWVHEKYRVNHPDWRIILAPGPDPWIKADAIMPAIEAANADVVIVADADVWTAGLNRAVMAIVCGEADWAMPHSIVHRLTEDGTERLMAGEDFPLPLDQRAYRGLAGGGFVVAQPSTLQSVPMDPRFVGWGQEDGAQGLALFCLVGPPWRGSDSLVHLWHPPQERMTRRWGSDESRVLFRRYLAAKRDPNLMAQLIEEIHAHRNAHQQALHPAAAG